MSGRTTAAEKLERLLYLLPAAAQDGGAELGELAGELGVDRKRVLREVEEVTARSFYQRPGEADHLQIFVEADRIRVWTAGEFARPVKLSPREALAVDLALRGLAAGHAEDTVAGEEDGASADRAEHERRRELARRLEMELAVASVEELAEHFALEGEARADADEGIRDVLFRAARERTWCRIRYLSSGADAPRWRTVAPYALVYGTGRWYAVSRCRAADGIRLFRLDRMLEATLEDGESFEVPDAFDVEEHLTSGRPYDEPEDPLDVRVRYDAEIARWIREQWPVEEAGDGAVVVTHSVADPDWIVRHVLQYGSAAEVLEPAGIRERVAEAAREVLSQAGDHAQ